MHNSLSKLFFFYCWSISHDKLNPMRNLRARMFRSQANASTDPCWNDWISPAAPHAVRRWTFRRFCCFAHESRCVFTPEAVRVSWCGSELLLPAGLSFWMRAFSVSMVTNISHPVFLVVGLLEFREEPLSEAMRERVERIWTRWGFKSPHMSFIWQEKNRRAFILAWRRCVLKEMLSSVSRHSFSCRVLH